MSNEVERSESGAPIYRHQRRKGEIDIVSGDDAAIQRISQHIEKHVGKVAFVFHELLSNLVHIDVHMVPPGPGRDYYTLITSGMSDRPMTAPDDNPQYRYAELVLCLPPDWPLEQEAFADETNYWPMRWLKVLARLPHEYNTWLFVGHTVPNGDPPKPFAPNTRLCCALLLQPVLFGPDFQRLDAGDGKVINFLSLVPLYREEMDFKLRHGLDPLLERLDAAGVNEFLDLKRKNVCKGQS